MVRFGAVVMLLGGLSGVQGARSGRLSRGNCGLKGGSSSFNISIVNGDDADECEWKWQVSLWQKGWRGRAPFCGGTLIAPDWVLTAAHCMGGEFDVVAGDYNYKVTSSNQQKIPMERSFSHPKYNPNNMHNDFALVKLQRPFDMTKCIGLACLPTGGDLKPGQDNCWATGFGTLSSGGKQPDILQEVELGILSNEACWKSKAYKQSEIDDSMICAQGFNRGQTSDACQGDSGGPLVCGTNGRWTVYGATSWGYGCADEKYPGIWARVYEELDWIQNTMASY